MRIELPYLPDKKLSPNWQPKSDNTWALRRREAEQMKSDVMWLCQEYVARKGATRFETVSVQYIFICNANRRRDPDNWVARMKSALDGLVQAGVLKDDSSEHVTILNPVFKVIPGPWPVTIIEVLEIEG